MHTTTRALLSALNPLRSYRTPHCIACMTELLPNDLVEFVTPSWVEGVPLILREPPLMWHANEACATSAYVRTYLRIANRWY